MDRRINKYRVNEDGINGQRINAVLTRNERGIALSRTSSITNQRNAERQVHNE